MAILDNMLSVMQFNVPCYNKQYKHAGDFMLKSAYFILLPFILFVSLCGILGYKLIMPKTETATANPATQRITISINSLHILTGSQGFFLQSLQVGQPFIIHVVATWCHNCAADAVMLSKHSILPIYAILWQDQLSAKHKLASAMYAGVALDKAGGYGIELGITGVPETLVVDADGMIACHYASPISEHMLEFEACLSQVTSTHTPSSQDQQTRP